METTITRKGQVTIPKHIRDSLSLVPGSKLVFDVNENGELVLRKSRPAKPRHPDRFDRAVGSAQIKWEGTTDEYMEFIRGYSNDPG
ncbi:MAG TPA: AbrB/MazE/SpoVT family DNA-binding domain-containing protein [Terracidiphilus sp.]|jgi:AbrB family looped-hinge helix DNA binding protein|nr:AbrB/MazE/SpoVT family DNA-binding domain-containing protein [Terracidiphilus sp.]